MVARRLKFTSPGSPPGAAGRRRATRTRASTLDRVHEPLEFVASHAAAFHQSRRQRVDFALVLSQYLSRGCATVGDPSLNFLYLANLVGGKQVQCVRAITAAGPIWQEMARLRPAAPGGEPGDVNFSLRATMRTARRHGYEATREAAMAAFAKSWRR